MEKIYDFEKIEGFTFQEFLKLFLGVSKRPELNFEKANLKVKLDNQEKFNKMVEKHLNSGSNIAIIGDYDVDGVCASAIMQKTLEILKKESNIYTFIPNRFRDGYGLNKNLVDSAICNKCSLIITVDNGIRANEAIDYAKSKGLDVIVTDHHVVGDDLPKADVIVNPHIGNEVLITKEICGATVAFLLCRNLLSQKNKIDNLILIDLAELAGLATITDVMPLVGENRLLVKFLLNKMHRNEDVNLGISALMKEMNVGRFEFNVESVSYGLGPCLNAPGRLDSAYTSFNLLMSKDMKEISNLVSEIKRLNDERKKLTTSLKNDAMSLTDDNDSVNMILFNCVSEGLLGIIAGKICESTNKPTFVGTFTNEGKIKCSGRAPKWCNLIETSTKAAKNVTNILGFGGHTSAMGISFENKNAFDDFKTELSKIVVFVEKVEEDQKFIKFPSLSLEQVKTILNEFEPFGETFEEPLFVCNTSVNLLSQMGENHCRFTGLLNGEKTNFYYFFNTLDPSFEGKNVNCYFSIHKEMTDSTGKPTYSCYVKKITKK